jgi:hypothetical protein
LLRQGWSKQAGDFRIPSPALTINFDRIEVGAAFAEAHAKAWERDPELLAT